MTFILKPISIIFQKCAIAAKLPAYLWHSVKLQMEEVQSAVPPTTLTEDFKEKESYGKSLWI